MTRIVLTVLEAAAAHWQEREMNHRVNPATPSDTAAWLDLAAEVGGLFGADMAHDPKFRASVERRIGDGEAFCVRIDGALAGAMLLSAATIDWLAVLRRFRRRGVGRALVFHAQSFGSDVRVTTFGAEHPHLDAQAAQKLYRAMGFGVDPGGITLGPDGTPRERLRWRVESRGRGETAGPASSLPADDGSGSRIGGSGQRAE